MALFMGKWILLMTIFRSNKVKNKHYLEDRQLQTLVQVFITW